MLNFNTMAETVLHHFKDGEGDTIAKMYVDDLNRIMKSRLEPGCSIGLHLHDTSSEIIFILSGTGTAILDGVEEILPPGTCHYCPKGHTHTLLNNGTEDLIFYAVVPQQ